MDKVQKIREEVERLMTELIQEKEKGFNSDIDDACILELQNVLTFIDSLQEEPVSEDLEKAANEYADGENPTCPCEECLIKTFKASALRQKQKTIDKVCEFIMNECHEDGLDVVCYNFNGLKDLLYNFRKVLEDYEQR